MSAPSLPAPDDLAAAGLRVDHDADAGVLTVTLDRPEKRNAQTPLMWRTLARVGDAVPAGVTVVVVRGEGAGFSAGLDRSLLGGGPPGTESIHEQLEHDDAGVAAMVEQYQRGFTWLRDPRFVSVAAVHGHAIGAGFQLALSCDLRLVARDASLCMKEAALGLVPDLTGTLPLVSAVGYARALEICATARTLDAEEAVRLGLALEVVDDLDVAVAHLVAALTATPPGTLAATKRVLVGCEERTLDQQRRHEREVQVGRLRAMAAAREGAAREGAAPTGGGLVSG